MFKESIGVTSLTSGEANSYFSSRIYGESFGSDNTILSTLRALLDKRMPENDILRVRFSTSYYTKRQVETHFSKMLLDNALGLDDDDYSRNTLFIFNVNSNVHEDNEKFFELVDEKFESSYDGWHIIPSVTELFKKSFTCRCFVNPELKASAVIVEELSVKRLHYLQCAILGFLPWYFDRSAGVSDDERELLYCMREKDASKYQEIINRFAKNYDFKTEKVRRMLSGFETRAEEIEIRSIHSSIEDLQSRIDDYNAQIGRYLKEIYNYNTKLLGLSMRIKDAEGDSEIMEYFLSNKHLFLEDVSGDTIYFAVNDYITYYEEEVVRRCIDNPNSFVYAPSVNRRGRSISPEDMKRLMTAVFIDCDIKMKTCAAYKFSIHGNVTANSGHIFPPEFSDCMPNIHINRYSCMGNYSRTINNLIADGDYISAIEQCIASAKSLNWTDHTVMCEFFKTLYGESDYGYNNVCFELPDKKVVSPTEAIKWLKSQEGNENE